MIVCSNLSGFYLFTVLPEINFCRSLYAHRAAVSWKVTWRMYEDILQVSAWTALHPQRTLEIMGCPKTRHIFQNLKYVVLSSWDTSQSAAPGLAARNAGSPGGCVCRWNMPRFTSTPPTAGALDSCIQHYYRKCVIINSKYLSRSDSILTWEQLVALMVYYSFQEK